MKSISIIVPVYNSLGTLDTCITSILSQKFEDYELLLVDDGSSDNSLELCREYATIDRRIRVFHKENGGVSSARNFGIEKACGKYLFFMDSDDYISPQYLTHMINMIIKYGDQIQPITAVRQFTQEDEVRQVNHNPIRKRRFTRRDIVKLYLEGLLNPPWNKLFQRETIIEHNIRFPEEISLGEDLLFNIAYVRVSGMKSFIVMDDVHYYYRQGSNDSLSRKFYENYFEMQNEQYKCLEQTAYLLKAPQEDMELLQERYGLFLFLTLEYNMRKDNPKSFFQKISDNNKLMRMDEFHNWIYKNSGNGNTVVTKIYLNDNFFFVWCLQKVLKIYRKIFHKTKKIKEGKCD